MACIINLPSSDIKLSFVNGKVLLDVKFLQQQVVPLSFCALHATLQIGSEELCVPLERTSNQQGDEFYILEESLSCKYIAVVKDSLVSSPQPITILDSPPNQSQTPIPLIDISSPYKESILEGGSTSAVHACKVGRSILPLLSTMKRQNTLTKILGRTKEVVKVNEIPRNYNGDIAFEFPPTMGKHTAMDSMEHKYDPHWWSKPQTSNIVFPGVCRRSQCLGALKCVNELCPRLVNHRESNTSHFIGSMLRAPTTGEECNNAGGRLVCHYCSEVALCVGTCNCFIYYVMPNDETMSRLMIHSGTHEHNVREGSSKQLTDRTKDMVSKVLGIDRHAGARKVQMCVAKEIVMATLMQDGGCKHIIGEQELLNVAEEMGPLIQDNWFRRSVSSARNGPTKESFGIDALLKLKRDCTYNFFHGSRFPGQGTESEKCFVFKMSTIGPSSGVDLVNRMRRSGSGDLKHAWVQFDHTRRIADWVTMACHVYDPSMQDLLTIATCEMKEEDMDAQCLFWECINEVMEKHGCKKADFRGFMADEAQANWNAVRHVYNKGKHNILFDRERSCLFHWEQSMVGHTTKYIVSTSQEEHKAMCEKWRMAPTNEAADSEARLIRQWWRNGHCMDKNIPAMDSWLSWWAVRIAHWGSTMTAVERSNDGPNTPRTNLAESKHGSWLAGEGYRRKISLYDACTTDMANAILQSTKAISYAQGKHIGKGPSLEKLKERIAARPAQVVRTVNEATEGTPMYKAPTPLTGDKETSRHKRKSKVVIDIEDDSTHRPEYNSHTRDRKHAGRPRKINFKSNDDLATPQRRIESKETGVIERKINEAMWAIRRTNIGSKVTCSGTPTGTRRCGQHIVGSSNGVPAPSFEGYRKHPKGLLRQWMWFCPDHVLHCYVVDKQIEPKPCPPPTIWPVNVGTNLSDEEVRSLLEGGYKVEQNLVDGMSPDPTRLNVGSSSNVQANNNIPSGFSTQNMSSGGSSMRNGIRVKYRTSISEEAAKKISLALKMKAKIIEEVCRIEHRHEVFKVESQGDNAHIGIYDVHIKDWPYCTCPDFVDRDSKKKPFIACKHMYFVYLRILGLSQNENMFIHQPIISETDLYNALSRNRTYPNLE